MTSDRPTPLDRMRRYASTLKEAGRSESDYVSVTLGDLSTIVMLADTLRADHADPNLGWTTAAIEAQQYERTERILRRLTVLVGTRASAEVQDAANKIYDEENAQERDKEWGRAREHLVYDLQQARQALKLERDISAERLEKIRDLKERTGEEPEEDADPTENAALRKDVEDLQLEREDWLEAKKELTRALDAVRKELKKKDDLVYSMRLNGARHNFEFAYDKPSINGSTYAQYCGVCDRERGHPAHFFSGAVYLDSRDVNEAVQAVGERLEAFLTKGVCLGHGLVHRTALDLLGGLPGIPLAEQPPQEDAELRSRSGQ